VNWILGHSYQSFTPTLAQSNAVDGTGDIVASFTDVFIYTFGLTLFLSVCFIALYMFVLRPRLIKKYLKRD
jgi:hypothetical protein